MYIGEASKITGATIKAIRHYEAIGLLTNISRFGNYRIYQSNDIITIQFIQMAQLAGFKLTELKSILGANNSDSIWCEIEALILEKHNEINLQIKKLQETQMCLKKHEIEIKLCLKINQNCNFPKIQP